MGWIEILLVGKKYWQGSLSLWAESLLIVRNTGRGLYELKACWSWEILAGGLYSIKACWSVRNTGRGPCGMNWNLVGGWEILAGVFMGWNLVRWEILAGPRVFTSWKLVDRENYWQGSLWDESLLTGEKYWQIGLIGNCFFNQSTISVKSGRNTIHPSQSLFTFQAYRSLCLRGFVENEVEWTRKA